MANVRYEVVRNNIVQGVLELDDAVPLRTLRHQLARPEDAKPPVHDDGWVMLPGVSVEELTEDWAALDDSFTVGDLYGSAAAPDAGPLLVALADVFREAGADAPKDASVKELSRRVELKAVPGGVQARLGPAPVPAPEPKPEPEPEPPATVTPRPMRLSDRFMLGGLPVHYTSEPSLPLGYLTPDAKVVPRRIVLSSYYYVDVSRLKGTETTPLARLQFASAKDPPTMSELRARLAGSRKMNDSERFISDGIQLARDQEASKSLLDFLAGNAALTIGELDRRSLVGLPDRAAFTVEDRDRPDTTKVTVDLPPMAEASRLGQGSDHSGKIVNIRDLDNDRLGGLFQDCRLLSAIVLDGDSFDIGPAPALRLLEGADRGFARVAVAVRDGIEMTAEAVEGARGRSFVEAGFGKVDSKLRTPWFSGGAEAGAKARFGGATRSKRKYAVCKWRCPRGEIAFQPGALATTLEVDRAVELALEASTDQRRFANLSQVFAYYGHVVATRVVVGGSLTITREQETQAEKDDTQLEVNARSQLAVKAMRWFQVEGGAAAGASHNVEQLTTSSFDREEFVARGGDTLLANDPGKWRGSLNEPDLWRPLDYLELMPLYAFLPAALRDRVIDVLNQCLSDSIGDIWSFSFSPGGDVFAISGNDNRLWRFSGELETWERLPVPAGTSGVFQSVAALPDGSVALTTYDKTPVTVQWSLNAADPARPAVFSATRSADQNVIHEDLPAPAARWITSALADDGVVLLEHKPQLHLHRLCDGQISDANFRFARALRYVANDHPDANPLEGNIQACTFRDGLVVLLRHHKSSNDAGEVSISSQRSLSCFDGKQFRTLRNDRDLLAIGVDLDDNLVAVQATARTPSDWTWVSHQIDAWSTATAWASDGFICCPNWRDYIGVRDWLPWIKFDPSTLGRRWLREMNRERMARHEEQSNA